MPITNARSATGEIPAAPHAVTTAAARDLVRRLLAARPDAIVVEMGLPVWRPPAGGYVATYGAARTSGQAAAEVLGFACR